ncbi:MAG TPA: rhodanese-like domain-containing protein [Pyrinomonadaceae bacterium]|nr:rhodanese-like domain-containing protein [Pyrinomonadaceae bacterium]
MRNSKLVSALVWLGVVLVSVAAVQAQQPVVNMISAEELKTKMTKNEQVTVIDVRSSEGFANSGTTVKGSIHYKLRKLKSRVNFAPLKDLPRSREIVTYCACPKDESSIAAAQILQAAGFTRVKVLQGGWHEWLRVNGPVQPRAKS